MACCTKEITIEETIPKCNELILKSEDNASTCVFFLNFTQLIQDFICSEILILVVINFLRNVINQ